LPEPDFARDRGLLWSGEREELVDALVAHLCAEAIRLTVDQFADWNACSAL
jgi:hypothetical protein